MPAWPAVEIVFPGGGAAADPGTISLQDRVLADLDGLDIVAIAEQPLDTWQVFFRSEAERAAALALLHAIQTPSALGLRPIDVDDEDWARRSQASLGRIRAGGIVVAPPWDAGGDAPGVITVIIEPAMGFGSGHHATTRLCLQALQRVDLHGCRVLDVGTGSGVLALAAARLGAAEVLAIDVDPDALDNARTNAELNGRPSNVEFREADFRQLAGIDLAADVVVANLTGGLLRSAAADLTGTLASGGTLILSGITAEERDAVYSVFEARLRMDWSADEEGWCCAVLRAEVQCPDSEAR